MQYLLGCHAIKFSRIAPAFWSNIFSAEEYAEQETTEKLYHTERCHISQDNFVEEHRDDLSSHILQIRKSGFLNKEVEVRATISKTSRTKKCLKILFYCL